MIINSSNNTPSHSSRGGGIYAVCVSRGAFCASAQFFIKFLSAFYHYSSLLNSSNNIFATQAVAGLPLSSREERAERRARGCRPSTLLPDAAPTLKSRATFGGFQQLSHSNRHRNSRASLKRK
jgi:hypothetical protein